MLVFFGVLRGWLVGDERGDEFGEFGGGEVGKGVDGRAEDIGGDLEARLAVDATQEAVREGEELVARDCAMLAISEMVSGSAFSGMGASDSLRMTPPS
jgi:hypothetical protein